MKRWGVWALGSALLVLGGLACEDLPIKSNLPTDDSKLFIAPLNNKTGEPGIDTLLFQKATQDFLIDGRLRLVPEDQADMVLKVDLERYDRLVMTFDQNQVPQQYKIQLVVDLELDEVRTHKVMWNTHTIVSLTPGEEVTGQDFDSTNTTSLRESTTYYVLNVAGVPPEDEPTAQNRLLDQMATRIVRRTIDGY